MYIFILNAFNLPLKKITCQEKKEQNSIDKNIFNFFVNYMKLYELEMDHST